LYEGSGAESVDADSRWAAVNALLEKGFAVTRAGADRPLAPADTTPLLVVGRWQNDVPPAGEATAKVRWGSLDPATVADQAEAARAEFSAPTPGAWRPWFPVIDYDRCTNCMQCLSFCLFGVYGVDEGKRIQVQNNDNCKTNCPACSRVCPEAAIMFPKYKAGPINGDVVSDSDLNREKMKSISRPSWAAMSILSCATAASGPAAGSARNAIPTRPWPSAKSASPSWPLWPETSRPRCS